MSWQIGCATCKQKDLDLMRCTGCYDVYYCSRECQRKHWTGGHKAQCKGKAKLGKSKEDKENKPSLANLNITSGEMKKVKDSQTDLEAEVKIKKEKNTQIDFPEEPTNREKHPIEIRREKGGAACAKCGGDTDLKVCAKCRKVSYCSRECQKQDWKRHQKECRLKDDTEFLDFTAFLRLTEMYKKASKSMKTFKDAVSTASILFHGRREIIDDLREVSSESEINLNFQNQVFVAYITRMHPLNFHRHGFYIQDRRGEETFVMFYLNNDDPAPYYQWDDLHPGRFICIICPILHHFLDMSTGFRIEDPGEICLLKF